LFCLDHKPVVLLKYRKKGVRGTCQGRCHWHVTPIVIEVYTNHKGQLKLTTLVHEFLHASGWGHTWEINGWSNFIGIKDDFSPLIVKDLTGKKQLIL